ILTWSLGSRAARRTRWPLTRVPLVLPRSRSKSSPSVLTMTQCIFETLLCSSRRSQSSLRPTTVRSVVMSMAGPPSSGTSWARMVTPPTALRTNRARQDSPAAASVINDRTARSKRGNAAGRTEEGDGIGKERGAGTGAATDRAARRRRIQRRGPGAGGVPRGRGDGKAPPRGIAETGRATLRPARRRRVGGAARLDALPVVPQVTAALGARPHRRQRLVPRRADR